MTVLARFERILLINVAICQRPSRYIWKLKFSPSGGALLEFEVGSGRVIKAFDMAVRGLSVGESKSVISCSCLVSTSTLRYFKQCMA